jgi:hypothetical protein
MCSGERFNFTFPVDVRELFVSRIEKLFSRLYIISINGLFVCALSLRSEEKGFDG